MFMHIIILILINSELLESFHGIWIDFKMTGGGLCFVIVDLQTTSCVMFASLQFHRPRFINVEDASMIPRSFIDLIEYYRHCFHFQLVSSFSSWKTESIHHTHHCLLLACYCLLAPLRIALWHCCPGNKRHYCSLEIHCTRYYKVFSNSYYIHSTLISIFTGNHASFTRTRKYCLFLKFYVFVLFFW